MEHSIGQPGFIPAQTSDSSTLPEVFSSLLLIPCSVFSFPFFALLTRFLPTVVEYITETPSPSPHRSPAREFHRPSPAHTTHQSRKDKQA